MRSGVDELKAKARALRRGIVDCSYRARANHIACNLSIVEILVVLFHRHLEHRPETFGKVERDRFLLSKGHAALSYYLTLADLGFFPRERVETDWHVDGATFCEHPVREIPGVELATGSLGHGIGVGCGIALGLPSRRCWVLVGDGECNEGSVWEAAAFAAAKELGNLTVIVDANGLQGLGRTKAILGDGIGTRFGAFGWNVIEVDGHDLEQLSSAMDAAVKIAARPTAIVAHTVKGKGISFMENDNAWHYTSLNEEAYATSCKELA